MRRGERIAGWVLSGAVAAFFVADGLVGLLEPRTLAPAMAETGFTASSLPLIGGIAIVAAVLSVLPRTALLGVVLLTGFIGGAICAHVRVSTGLVPEEIVLTIAGLAAWAGLWLREPRLRALTPVAA